MSQGCLQKHGCRRFELGGALSRPMEDGYPGHPTPSQALLGPCRLDHVGARCRHEFLQSRRPIQVVYLMKSLRINGLWCARKDNAAVCEQSRG